MKIIISLLLILTSSANCEVLFDNRANGPAFQVSTGLIGDSTSYFGEEFSINSSYEISSIDFNFSIGCRTCLSDNEWIVPDPKAVKMLSSFKEFVVGFFKVGENISQTPFVTSSLKLTADSFRVAGHTSYVSYSNYPYFHASAALKKPVTLEAGRYVVAVWGYGIQSANDTISLLILEGPRASEPEEITARIFRTNTGWYPSMLGQDSQKASYRLIGKEIGY